MSTWRKHLIICLFLGLLGVPIYFLDQAFTQREAAIGSPTNFDGDRLYRRRKADCVSKT